MTDQSAQKPQQSQKPTKKTPTCLQPLHATASLDGSACMTRLMTHKTAKSQNRPVGNGVFNFY